MSPLSPAWSWRRAVLSADAGLLVVFSLVSSLLFCLVPCGRLSWLLASFWAYVNVVHRIVSYRINLVRPTTVTSLSHWASTVAYNTMVVTQLVSWIRLWQLRLTERQTWRTDGLNCHGSIALCIVVLRWRAVGRQREWWRCQIADDNDRTKTAVRRLKQFHHSARALAQFDRIQ